MKKSMVTCIMCKTAIRMRKTVEAYFASSERICADRYACHDRIDKARKEADAQERDAELKRILNY